MQTDYIELQSNPEEGRVLFLVLGKQSSFFFLLFPPSPPLPRQFAGNTTTNKKLYLSDIVLGSLVHSQKRIVEMNQNKCPWDYSGVNAP